MSTKYEIFCDKINNKKNNYARVLRSIWFFCYFQEMREIHASFFLLQSHNHQLRRYSVCLIKYISQKTAALYCLRLETHWQPAVQNMKKMKLYSDQFVIENNNNNKKKKKNICYGSFSPILEHARTITFSNWFSNTYTRIALHYCSFSLSLKKLHLLVSLFERNDFFCSIVWFSLFLLFIFQSEERFADYYWFFNDNENIFEIIIIVDWIRC